MSLAYKIKKVRKTRKFSQEEMANALGMNVRPYGDWERGTTTPNSDNITKFIKVNNINPSWFLLDKGSMFLDDISSLITINDIKTNLPCISLDKEKLSNFVTCNLNDIKAIYIEDDSMETTIKKNSLLLVDASIKEFSNGIFVYKQDDNYDIKRIQIMPGNKIKAISDNKIYSDFSIDINNTEIIGRVIWSGSAIK